MRCFEAKSSSKSRGDDYSLMNWVMLKFRPIVPKPAAGDQPTSGAAPQNSVKSSVKRTKRRYVRSSNKQSARTKKSRIRDEPDEDRESNGNNNDNNKVTLQLLPAPERSEDNNSLGIMNFQKAQENLDLEKLYGGNGAAGGQARAAAETWIIVECVTDTHAEGGCGVGLGFSDRERMCNLEADTCPGFVTDCGDRVVWMNEACRRMIGGTAVRVVVREKLPSCWPSFACRVRLMQHAPRRSATVACDVWRMESAGFAWKLDVTTALGLRSFQ